MLPLPAFPFKSRGCDVPEKVSCQNCGFLGFRHIKTREIVEAEEGVRQGGNWMPVEGNKFLYEEHPICFARAVDFFTVMGSGGLPEKRRKELLSLRDCDKFTPWVQGFTPKKHLEMNLLQQQQERLDRREREDREWRRKHDEDERIARDNQAKLERQWRKEDTRFRLTELLVMGGLVTLILVIVQIVAAYIQRG